MLILVLLKLVRVLTTQVDGGTLLRGQAPSLTVTDAMSIKVNGGEQTVVIFHDSRRRAGHLSL